MNRRDFLRLVGVGAAAALVEEPIRKMWFVPSNAPVGSRVERPMRLVNTVTGESVGFGSVDVQFGDQPPVFHTVNSNEWFYRELADKAGYEIRVPVGWNPPWPVYWSNINDPADVQIDPELHRQLHIEAAKRYREEHGRNYWDPPAFELPRTRRVDCSSTQAIVESVGGTWPPLPRTRRNG